MSSYRAFALGLPLAVFACTASDSPLASNIDVTTCIVTPSSMIETIATDPGVVTEARFNLKRVFNQIRTTTPAGTTPALSALAMFRELYASFADCTSSSTLDPEHYGLSCRASEAGVAKLDPFTTTPGALHYTPVALVDRFDLAAADGSTCGESRIIFWATSGLVGRAAIIVEMRTPPVVVKGVSSCAPVAQFWANLSSVTDETTRGNLLESFFFDGLPGMPFAPVSAKGVGFSGAGQVRLNSFVDNTQWNLRELKYKPVCTGSGSDEACAGELVQQTTKANPSQLLFAGSNSEAPAFQSWFVNQAVPALAAATDVNQIALGNANVFNTYESVSEPFPGDPTNVQYAQLADASLTKRVTAQLASLGSPLAASDIYNRATTQTCGGCHQVSDNVQLGGGLVWPSSFGFVHVDESGTQSFAELATFIPHRMQVLGNFTGCTVEGGSGVGGVDAGVSGGSDGSGDPNLTIDGRPIDSPN